MREVPECLNRRYKALDELVQELTRVTSNSVLRPGGTEECMSECESTTEPGIKLMCEFWNILKDDPDCNLTHHVKQRMGLSTSSNVFPQHVTCYMAEKKNAMAKLKSMCCKKNDSKCCAKQSDPASQASSSTACSPPLGTALGNLKQAASFDKQCNVKVNELMSTQIQLMAEITRLEGREKDGVKLLKQADCMWGCMEDAYKKRVAESQERQKVLLRQLKDVEASNLKWRKNKKDLDTQMSNITKCHKDITEKLTQKLNDIKCIDIEIDGYKKRNATSKKEMETVKASLNQKKQASDMKIANIAAEVTCLQKSLGDENKYKNNKESEGTKFVRDAREDLQKICRVLLQKKLENEDLRAEKSALLLEIDLLNDTMDQCKDRCQNKQKALTDDIKKINAEIAAFKQRCVQCHQCTDTSDARRHCTDCPRCAQERDCIFEEGHCTPDGTQDCVCMSVKHKFLDNVFDNMSSVLQNEAKAPAGKAVAESVLKCLRRSRNGKLNDDTRKQLQEFIVSSVKKNLNVTIIGGAVKTRCEMDADTYQQLMLCLKQVNADKPPKTDKGTAAKKTSCPRWGGTSECNCPSGAKDCVCSKKAPPPVHPLTPCAPPKDGEDGPGEKVMCPNKESTACGPDCGMRAVPSLVGTDVAQWRPDSCSGSGCLFSKSMRAAQCVLGPESLNAIPKTFTSLPPFDDTLPDLEDVRTCRCGKNPIKPCTCRDRRSRPRERIIEEVMGRYIEVSPIEKVTSTTSPLKNYKTRNYEDGNYSANDKRRLTTKALQNHDSSSEFTLLQDTDALLEMLNQRKQTCHGKQHIRLFLNPTESKKKRDIDTNLTVILDPKFHPPYKKMDENTSPFTSYMGSCDSRCCEEASFESYRNKIERDSSFSSYSTNDLRGTVTNLIKDVIVSHAKTNYDPEVEWMTVSSIIKKLTSVPKTSGDNDSNVTNKEMEVTNETLDGPSNYFKNGGVKSYTVLDKINTNSTSPESLNIKSFQGLSHNETAKRNQHVNEILNSQINEYSYPYSASSTPDSYSPLHVNYRHDKCLKYFIQNMVGKYKCQGTALHETKHLEPCHKFQSTSLRSSKRTKMKLHEYLRDNFVKRESSAFKESAKPLKGLLEMQKSPKTDRRRPRKIEY